jgi:hypothetical protein
MVRIYTSAKIIFGIVPHPNVANVPVLNGFTKVKALYLVEGIVNQILPRVVPLSSVGVLYLAGGYSLQSSRIVELKLYKVIGIASEVGHPNFGLLLVRDYGQSLTIFGDTQVRPQRFFANGLLGESRSKIILLNSFVFSNKKKRYYIVPR